MRPPGLTLGYELVGTCYGLLPSTTQEVLGNDVGLSPPNSLHIAYAFGKAMGLENQLPPAFHVSVVPCDAAEVVGSLTRDRRVGSECQLEAPFQVTDRGRVAEPVLGQPNRAKGVRSQLVE